MNNNTFIRNYVYNIKSPPSYGNLSIRDNILFSYDTALAYRVLDGVLLNSKYYSATTSKHKMLVNRYSDKVYLLDFKLFKQFVDYTTMEDILKNISVIPLTIKESDINDLYIPYFYNILKSYYDDGAKKYITSVANQYLIKYKNNYYYIATENKNNIIFKCTKYINQDYPENILDKLNLSKYIKLGNLLLEEIVSPEDYYLNLAYDQYIYPCNTNVSMTNNNYYMYKYYKLTKYREYCSKIKFNNRVFIPTKGKIFKIHHLGE